MSSHACNSLCVVGRQRLPDPAGLPATSSDVLLQPASVVLRYVHT